MSLVGEPGSSFARVRRSAVRRFMSAAVAAVVSTPALGATVTWDGGAGADGNWSTASNWSTNALPANTDDVVFASGFGSTDLQIGSDRVVNSLTISTLSSFMLTGRLSQESSFPPPSGTPAIVDTLKITSGTLTRTDLSGTEQAQVLRVPIILDNNAVWTLNGGTSVTVDRGVFQDSGDPARTLTKNGGGILVINRNFNPSTYDFTNPAYQGSTTINAGVIHLGTTLGSAPTLAGAVTVGNGATLSFDGGSVGGVVTASGIGLNIPFLPFYGAISGANGSMGGLTLAGTTLVGIVDGGTITVHGPVTSTAAQQLNKDGPGTLTLNGSTTAFAGPLNLNAGALRITASNAASAGGTTVAPGAMLEYKRSSASSGQNLTQENRPLVLNGAGPAGLGALYNISHIDVQIPGQPPQTLVGTNTWAGSVTLATDSTIGVASSSRLVISGAIGGAGGLTKSGEGELVLAGANTFSGPLSIASGLLSLDHPQALPAQVQTVAISANSGLGVKDGGNYSQALQLSGGRLTLAEQVSSAATWAGSVDLLADSTADVPAGTLTISGKINGAFAMNKVGNGVLSITNTANGFTALNVQEGVLLASVPGALPTSGITVSDGASVRLAPGSTFSRVLRLNGQGKVAQIGSITLIDGALNASDAGNSTWSGSVTLQSDSTIRSGAEAHLVITGIVSGTGKLTKVGGGILRLNSTNNSYAGGTEIDQGILRLNFAALPDQAAAGGASVAAGAALELGGSFTQNGVALTLAGSGIGGTGALRSISSTPTWGGAVALGTDAVIGTDAATTLTLSGIVSGSQPLRKLGAGTLVLSNSNSYTGGTHIEGGVLSAASDSSLGPSSTSVTFDQGARLAFTASTTTSRRFDLNGGTLQAGSGATVTYDSAIVMNGSLRGPGTHSFEPDSVVANLTSQAGAHVVSALTNVTFNNFVNAGALDVPTGRLNWEGGHNQSSGVLTIGGATTLGQVFTQGFHNDGAIVINPNASRLDTNGNDLVSGGGSRITINSGGRLQLGAAELDLHGSLLVNNGLITAGAVNVHYGSLAAGNGSFPTVNVHPGGSYTPGVTLANMPAPGPLSTGLITPLDPNQSVTTAVNLMADSVADVMSTEGTLTLGSVGGDGAALTKTGAGTLAAASVRIGTLDVNEGAVRILANGSSSGTSVVEGLRISTRGRLDLSNNDLVVRGGNLRQITEYVASGRAGGKWNGVGMISSVAGPNTGLAVVPNNDGKGQALYATFSGQSVALDDVLVKFTYYGDADLNGVVDGGDYFLADSGFLDGGERAGWRFGDFNYDGRTTIADYLLMDRAMARQSAVLAGESRAGATTAVPEPGVAMLTGLLLMASLKRRRGRAC